MDDDDIVLDNFDPFADLEPLPGFNSTTNDPLASSQKTGTKRGGTDDDPTAKRRKPRVPKKKLDANLLLSDRGLPRLRHETPWLRFGPKGEEDANLRKLMEFYQMWAHSLFPSLNFRDFASKATKACSTSRCKITLATWQQEYRDKQQQATREDNVETDLSGMTLEDEDAVRRQQSSSPSHTEETNSSIQRPPSNNPLGGMVASSTTTAHHNQSNAFFSSDEEDEDRPLFVPIVAEKNTKKTQKTAALSDEQQARIKANREAALKALAERRRKQEVTELEDDPGAEYVDDF